MKNCLNHNDLNVHITRILDDDAMQCRGMQYIVIEMYLTSRNISPVATVCNDYLFHMKYVEMMNENSQAKKQ